MRTRIRIHSTALINVKLLSWEPLPAETTPAPSLAASQPSARFYLILYSLVPVLVLLVVGLAGAYIYRCVTMLSLLADACDRSIIKQYTVLRIGIYYYPDPDPDPDPRG